MCATLRMCQQLIASKGGNDHSSDFTEKSLVSLFCHLYINLTTSYIYDSHSWVYYTNYFC